jgi:hypothetical protein
MSVAFSFLFATFKILIGENVTKQKSGNCTTPQQARFT